MSAIVPIGLVAAMGSLAAGCVEDVALIAGLHYSNGHSLTRLWYDGLLPSAGGLFCAYFSIKARFVVVRTLALLTALGMASRVVMNWESFVDAHFIVVIRFLVSMTFVAACWFYDRRLQLEQQPVPLPQGLKG